MSGADGELVVVTGAASGVGRATVRRLRESGAHVVGVDLAGPPEAAGGTGGLSWVRGDVAAQETWDETRAVCDRLRTGGPDSVITSAADIVVAPFLETGVDQWRRLFDINVLGVVRAMRTFIPPMIARGRGGIAVVCSVNSFVVEDQMSAYSTSKAALLHVVRSAALEHARQGLRINAVCPGAIDTPLLRRHLGTLDNPGRARELVERRTPTGRIVRPEEVADVLCFLVSSAASGMSGAAVTVDGGLTSTYDYDSSSG